MEASPGCYAVCDKRFVARFPCNFGWFLRFVHPFLEESRAAPTNLEPVPRT
jgi:hypothetical protein